MNLYSDASLRALDYSQRRGLVIEKQLGAGTQGVVFSTNRRTAVKSLIRQEHYLRERDVYFRLRDRAVTAIEGFAVPQLVHCHDELWIVEMQIVSPPYVLDFASAYLDELPPYIAEADIMHQWEREKREQFGDHWPRVQTILSQFRAMGIHLADIRPGNIDFGPDAR